MTGQCERCEGPGPIDERGTCADCAQLEADVYRALDRQSLAELTAQAHEAARYAREHGTVAGHRCEACGCFMGLATETGLCTLCGLAERSGRLSGPAGKCRRQQG